MIGVRYSCPECGLADVEVQVPERGAADVVVWFRGTLIPAISADHAQRSPACHPATLSAVKIPHSEGSEIGNPTKH